MAHEFERIGSETLLETPIFNLRKDRAKHPLQAAAGDYFVLEMPDFVNMVAETAAGDVILVRQWRHGARSMELELPAGLVDPDEDALTAAKRELLEETGALAERWDRLGEVLPNPAIMSNRCTTFWGIDCKREQAQALDHDEDIEVVEVRGEDVAALVRGGTLRSAQMVAALLWWLDKRARIQW